MHEFAVFALTCHEKHEKFLSSHTRSIIFQDHQIKYMRAWLESVLLTAASFGCQAIYRRMSRRKKKCESCCCCCYSSSLLLFFSSSSLSLSYQNCLQTKREWKIYGFQFIFRTQWERVRDEEEVNTFRYLLQVTIGRHDTLINYLCHTLWNCYVKSLDEKWKKNYLLQTIALNFNGVQVKRLVFVEGFYFKLNKEGRRFLEGFKFCQKSFKIKIN